MLFRSNGYWRCSWAGQANSEKEALQNFVWRFFSVKKISTSKSNNYKSKPIEGSACENSGDTFDVTGGILECRYINGRKFQWIKINDVKKTFVNTQSPVSIDTCKLQNSASTADKSGRNVDAGLIGFPFINSDKNGMNAKGNNEVLIVPVDFPDFPGGSGVTQQLENDKKWLTDWYNYFSNGQSKFNVTTLNRWLRMPQNRASYPTDAKTTSALQANANQLQGSQAQAFINEITKEFDLTKFSTVYVFFPDGEYFNNDLIVRKYPFKVKEGQKTLNFYSWGRNLEGQETLKWAYYVHETIHDFNIVGHAPGNGWPLGMMTNQSGISLAMNPYERFLLDWLPANQIYCDDVSTLKTATISLTPVEREDRKTKMAI